MSGYSWSIPSAAPATTTTATERASARARLWGRDKWLDVTSDGADVVTTPSKDIALVEGQEALRQWILRTIVTAPGDWATLPDYGAGARLYVKAKNTRATRDELAERIRSQLLRNPRIEEVDDIVIEALETGQGLHVVVKIKPKGRPRPDDSLAVALEVR